MKIAGPMTPAFGEILSTGAMELVEGLVRKFGSQRTELLELREQRQAQIDAGERPDFLSGTEPVRSADSDPQIADIRKKKMEFMKAKIRAEADRKIAHMEMEALVHSQSVDAPRIRALGNDIIAAKTKMIRAMIEAKIAILNIMTPEQRKKASKMHGMHN